MHKSTANRIADADGRILKECRHSERREANCLSSSSHKAGDGSSFGVSSYRWCEMSNRNAPRNACEPSGNRRIPAIAPQPGPDEHDYISGVAPEYAIPIPERLR